MNVVDLLRRLRPKSPSVPSREEGIYRRFQGYTMIPPETYVANLQLAERVRGVPGAVVECGVWRGGMIGGIAALLGPDRPYHLFDSFEGLPPAKAVDGPAALAWQKDTNSENYHDNCTAPIDLAREAMIASGAPSYHLHKGWFNATLPSFDPGEPIALLRLDGDWYDSTMDCLNHLFHRVAPGGLIVLDDYYTWDGCSRALHDFLSQRQATERIESYAGICFLRKLESAPARADRAQPSG